MNASIANGKFGQELKKNQGEVYENVWKEESFEGRDCVVIIISEIIENF